MDADQPLREYYSATKAMERRLDAGGFENKDEEEKAKDEMEERLRVLVATVSPNHPFLASQSRAERAAIKIAEEEAAGEGGSTAKMTPVKRRNADRATSEAKMLTTADTAKDKTSAVLDDFSASNEKHEE